MRLEKTDMVRGGGPRRALTGKRVAASAPHPELHLVPRLLFGVDAEDLVLLCHFYVGLVSLAEVVDLGGEKSHAGDLAVISQLAAPFGEGGHGWARVRGVDSWFNDKAPPRPAITTPRDAFLSFLLPPPRAKF